MISQFLKFIQEVGQVIAQLLLAFLGSVLLGLFTIKTLTAGAIDPLNQWPLMVVLLYLNIIFYLMVYLMGGVAPFPPESEHELMTDRIIRFALNWATCAVITGSMMLIACSGLVYMHIEGYNFLYTIGAIKLHMMVSSLNFVFAKCLHCCPYPNDRNDHE